MVMDLFSRCLSAALVHVVIYKMQQNTGGRNGEEEEEETARKKKTDTDFSSSHCWAHTAAVK